MANDIQLVTKYLPLLGEVYKQSAKTAILEAPENMVRATEEANVFKIAKLSFDGLGDYDKTTGLIYTVKYLQDKSCYVVQKRKTSSK